STIYDAHRCRAQRGLLKHVRYQGPESVCQRSDEDWNMFSEQPSRLFHEQHHSGKPDQSEHPKTNEYISTAHHQLHAIGRGWSRSLPAYGRDLRKSLQLQHPCTERRTCESAGSADRLQHQQQVAYVFPRHEYVEREPWNHLNRQQTAVGHPGVLSNARPEYWL